MRNSFFSIIVVAMFAVQTTSAGSTEVLDDEAVESAIVAGQRENNPDKFGAHYDWFNGIFKMSVHSPTSWIAYQSARVAQGFKTLRPEDVTPEMREQVLRITANWAGKIKTMVIRSDNDGKTVVIHPTTKPCDKLPGEIFASCGIQFVFSLTELETVRRADKDGKGEFLITVQINAEFRRYDGRFEPVVEQKDFKVKESDLKDLSLQ